MVGRTPASGQGRGGLRKYGLPPCICVPSTTSTAPASTTLVSDAFSVSLGPHTQELVMILNLGYHNLEP